MARLLHTCFHCGMQTIVCWGEQSKPLEGDFCAVFVECCRCQKNTANIVNLATGEHVAVASQISGAAPCSVEVVWKEVHRIMVLPGVISRLNFDNPYGTNQWNLATVDKARHIVTTEFLCECGHSEIGWDIEWRVIPTSFEYKCIWYQAGITVCEGCGEAILIVAVMASKAIMREYATADMLVSEIVYAINKIIEGAISVIESGDGIRSASCAITAEEVKARQGWLDDIPKW